MRPSVFLALALTAGACAQEPTKPTDTLPPPPFAEWRQVPREDDSVERRTLFPSALTTGSPENDAVPLRLLLPADARGPVPVVVILHYWGASDQRAEISLARELNRRNVGAALIALPYHLERAPKGTRSGARAITADPARLRGTMLQGALDVRRALDLLSREPDVRVDRAGIVGISLGAVVGALAKATDPRLVNGAFLLGGIDLARIIWTSSLVVPQRDALRRQGITENKLREILKDVEPGTYLTPRDGDRSFVVNGKYDTVIPPENADQLAAALGDVRRLQLETGHYGGVFVQRRLLRETADFFEASFAGRAWNAPKAIYAPTLRIGIKLDAPTGLDVGLGIDLLKFDRRGDTFATLFLTPRGPQIFAGARLGRGLSFGATLSRSGPALGFLYSVVL